MKRSACFLLGICLALPLSRWGVSGHKLIAAKSVEALAESPFKSFAVANKEYLVDHSLDPDTRRNSDPREGPNHYIDLELYGIQDPKSPLLVSGFPEPKSSPSASPEEKPKGRVPWRIEEMYDRLVLEMKTGGWEQARLTMAELAHYLADATVPLHATQNYDGQMSGQEGAHARFETWLVDGNLSRLESSARPDSPVKALDAAARHAAIWATLRGSFEEVIPLLKADKDALKESAEEARFKKLWESRGEVVEKRINKAVWIVAAFWQSAWEEAGRPDPFLLAPSRVLPKEKAISSEQAKDHVGEEATVEFVVAKVGFSKKSGTHYINSHDPHEGYFAGVVFSDGLSKIEKSLGLTLREGLEGKKVRIRGKIQLYKGSTEIVVEKPEQISLVP